MLGLQRTPELVDINLEQARVGAQRGGAGLISGVGVADEQTRWTWCARFGYPASEVLAAADRARRPRGGGRLVTIAGSRIDQSKVKQAIGECRRRHGQVTGQCREVALSEADRAHL